MTYQVEYSRQSTKQISALPDSIQSRIKLKIAALADDPRPSGVKKLTGYDDLYRVKVGNYRIVYEIKDQKLIVFILKVDHRSKVYRDF